MPLQQKAQIKPGDVVTDDGRAQQIGMADNLLSASLNRVNTSASRQGHRLRQLRRYQRSEADAHDLPKGSIKSVLSMAS